MLITVHLYPQQQGRFLPQIPHFYIFISDSHLLRKYTTFKKTKYYIKKAQKQLCAAACDRVKDQINLHKHLEKRMFMKVLRHIFVPSSGLDEKNNIKGAFYPVVP